MMTLDPQLGAYLAGFIEKGGFKNVQAAVRDIIRDRKRNDEIAAAASSKK